MSSLKELFTKIQNQKLQELNDVNNSENVSPNKGRFYNRVNSIIDTMMIMIIQPSQYGLVIGILEDLLSLCDSDGLLIDVLDRQDLVNRINECINKINTINHENK